MAPEDQATEHEDEGGTVAKVAPSAPAMPKDIINYAPCPLVIRDGTFELPEGTRSRVVLEAARPRLEAVLRSVGRLECPERRPMPQCGTAWLVRDDIAVTNRHTIVTYLDDLRRGDKTLRIDFCAELGAPQDERCAVRRVLYVAPDHDLAFLQVAPGRSARAGIPIADRIDPGHALAVIGFPTDEDSFYDKQKYAACFKDGFDRAGQGFKRLSLGRLEAVTADTLEHDCTTLGGSSGGVILDLVRGEAVGLNFGVSRTRDRPRPTNLGVPGWIVRERLARLEL